MRGYASKTNRITKAKKIVTVLEEALGKPLHNMKVLDIGTGNGDIAKYIASNGNCVYAVDMENMIENEDGIFQFLQVNDEKLPFEDNYFDVVISNQVIEHVENGLLHLHEIYRVLNLDEGGVCYFATPNRTFPIEVHTHTVGIHYLPYNMFWYLLKILHKYREPIRLLTYRKMLKMFADVGFIYEDWTIKVVNNPEKYHMRGKWHAKFPQFLSAVSPTNIFILMKKSVV